jgi:hypothetical protein
MRRSASTTMPLKCLPASNAVIDPIWRLTAALSSVAGFGIPPSFHKRASSRGISSMRSVIRQSRT